jgi:glutamate N-acetyltransferase/amino-acid N-acetyltransferase
MADLHLLSPLGFRASGVYAGLKSRQSPDIGLLVCADVAAAAAVFTTNQVCAAPVIIGRQHIRKGKLRGVVVNSGNANACTGKQGEKDAIRMCQLAASVANASPYEFLPSSTGIIGHMLPMDKVERGIVEAGQYLGDSMEHAHLFADAILTTDLKRKAHAVEFKIGRETATLAGVCKGSGMIGPRMALPHATMLAYLTTDVQISPASLRKLLQAASDRSFNAVTVDDHTSTNDTACLLASGHGPKIDSPKSLASFAKALDEVCQSLAYQIAADGEGATKVVKITVAKAKTERDAQTMARAIANSPLVKCAMHGNDPNWGRIVSAAGLTSAKFDPDKAILNLQGTIVFRKGRPLPFDAQSVSQSLATSEVNVLLTCNLGESSATVWTCDLSREYIAINADYHT